MAWADIRSGAWRSVVLTLAALALAVRVAMPQGFMLASFAPEAVPQLVICTGHGPLKASPSAPAGKLSPDAPCVFAGHGAGAAPEPAPAVQALAVAHASEPRLPAPADLAPGRGLAAPPPPSSGPPLTV